MKKKHAKQEYLIKKKLRGRGSIRPFEAEKTKEMYL